MGDRTQVDFDFASDKALKLAAAEFGEPSDWTEPWAAQWPEVNYGGLQEREDIARAGAVFIGSHHEGGEYGPMRFVGFEGELHEHPCSIDYELTVELPDTAWEDVFHGRWSVLLGYTNRIYRYLEVERRAEQYLRRTSVYAWETGEFKAPAEAVAEFAGDEPLEFGGER